ncbi:MAG: hypothetical protein PVF27_07065 [Gemmatimonadales bacterium]|jgi:hypothetical protein
MDFGTIIWLGVTGVAAVWGYAQTRQFVRRRLRFVDAVHKPAAPVIAGAAAALITAPVSFLPIVTLGSAAIFGVGVGVGVRHGSRDSHRLPSAGL